VCLLPVPCFHLAFRTIYRCLRSPVPRQPVFYPLPPSLHLAALQLPPRLRQRQPKHDDDHPLDPHHSPVPCLPSKTPGRLSSQALFRQGLGPFWPRADLTTLYSGITVNNVAMLPEN